MKLSRLWFALVLVLSLALAACAEPTLKPLADTPLPNAFQTEQKYVLRLLYEDSKGDDITKATFHDEAGGSPITIEKKSVDGKPDTGATITWDINKFTKGSHQGYFVVKTDAGETRYPSAKDEYYSFRVESVIDKWVLTGIGWVICLGAVPFLFYLLARTLNPRGNPSSVARVGLIVGIFLALAIFIWQFMGIYDNPLIWVMAVVGALALLIVVMTRR